MTFFFCGWGVFQVLMLLYCHEDEIDVLSMRRVGLRLATSGIYDNVCISTTDLLSTVTNHFEMGSNAKILSLEDTSIPSLLVLSRFWT